MAITEKQLEQMAAAMLESNRSSKDTTAAILTLAKAIGEKHDPASTVSNWSHAHGPGGLFSGAGVRPDMFSTVPRPVDLSAIIPLIASRMENEVYEILTGVTVTEGSRAVDICSEGPTPGKLKVCRQVISMGTMKLDTSVERLTAFGKRIDYSDLDRNVLNLDPSTNPLMPDVLNTENVNTSTGKLLFEAGLAVEKSLARMDILGVNGNVSNNADFNLWITQYDGLDRLIRTGYVDQPSQVACAAADSVVTTHNAPIASAGTNGQTFIANVVNSYRAIKQRAEIIGMGDFQAVILMHPNAAWAIYDVWACNYNTDRCTGSAGNPVPINATDVVQFRDTMRRGAYLLIDGEAVPVVFSSGMQWDGVSNNTFNTDIFIVPLNWRGRPLLYRHFFPLNNADAQQWVSIQPLLSQPKILNGGLYAMGARTTNGFCTKLEFISQSRLILDTPFLAARINDVQVGYAIAGFDAFVGQSGYRDGGQSTGWGR